MIRLTRDEQEASYTVVEDGKTVGRVTRPMGSRVFGRRSGTVYLARPAGSAPVLRRKKTGNNH